MRQFIASLFVMALLVGAAFWHTSIVHAQAASQMTDERIARIRANCTSAQSAMDQLLRNSDTSLRINRGQVYDFIAQKLMIPLNNRLALAGYDTVGEVTLTNQFQRDVDAFKANYIDYRAALTNAINMNCKDQPVSFYDAVSDARDKRAKVANSIQTINQHIDDYKTEFEIFARTYKGDAS